MITATITVPHASPLSIRGRSWTDMTGDVASRAVAGPAITHSESRMSVRPVLFGYLRAQAGAADHLIAWLHRELNDYAEREGFSLAAVFVERTGGGRSALMALIDALNRREAQAVVVPALDHLSCHADDRRGMRHLIERETGVPILVLYPSADDPC